MFLISIIHRGLNSDQKKGGCTSISRKRCTNFLFLATLCSNNKNQEAFCKSLDGSAFKFFMTLQMF